MKIDRFLGAILAGIGLLVVISLVFFFTRQNRLEYGPEDSPEGVLHNYAVALHDKDFNRAYQYLAEAEHKPSFDAFRQAFLANASALSGASLKIDQTTIEGDTAYLSITIVHASSSLFADSYRDTQSGMLEKQSGSWKILNLPFPYFNWDWYQPVPAK
jgi:hypothetical protein